MTTNWNDLRRQSGSRTWLLVLAVLVAPIVGVALSALVMALLAMR